MSGSKDSFKVRQSSSFKGKSDFGQWSIPFEKVKKVVLIRGEEEKKKEDILIKESQTPSLSSPKELDKITLRNGDILLGNISVEIISIKTNYGTLSFKKEDISRFSFGTSERAHKEKESDTLYSKYGDKLTGIIYAPQIKMVLLTGTNLSILREHIKEIEFGIRVDNEKKTIQEKFTEPTSPKIQ